MSITNEEIRDYEFLSQMSLDDSYPAHLVNKGKLILIHLCEKIESNMPNDLDELYVLTQASTDEFNDLADEFYENDSEIESVARDCIVVDFDFIASAYGFDADSEELVGTRDW
ncbi:MAG: hypothetical protein HGA87_05955 [Desulfobulbaceae bacterium]|nr:hypothetical protein [Desulfobulbaceae bacterium]